MSRILPVITHPAPSLREQSRALSISEIHDAGFVALFEDMITTMYADDGIGLAAPQVGHNVRVIVIGKDALAGQPPLPFPVQDLVLINPEIESYSFKTAWEEEGCLSVPGVRGDVLRHIKIKANATLPSGTTVSFDARDYLARAIQHEIDHLNGILFIDRAKNIQKVARRAAL